MLSPHGSPRHHVRTSRVGVGTVSGALLVAAVLLRKSTARHSPSLASSCPSFASSPPVSLTHPMSLSISPQPSAPPPGPRAEPTGQRGPHDPRLPPRVHPGGPTRALRGGTAPRCQRQRRLHPHLRPQADAVPAVGRSAQRYAHNTHNPRTGTHARTGTHRHAQARNCGLPVAAAITTGDLSRLSIRPRSAPLALAPALCPGALARSLTHPRTCIRERERFVVDATGPTCSGTAGRSG
jgi:hypothetical protein